MSQLLKRFVREEEGATMVEYGLMVALIAVVCIAVIAVLGRNLDRAFTDVNDEVAGVVTGGEASP